MSLIFQLTALSPEHIGTLLRMNVKPAHRDPTRMPNGRTVVKDVSMG